MRGYYVPSSKKELVEWLSRYFKKPLVEFNKMEKKQLYAIYFRMRDMEK